MTSKSNPYCEKIFAICTENSMSMILCRNMNQDVSAPVSFPFTELAPEFLNGSTNP
jgi:hypothetical protein